MNNKNFLIPFLLLSCVVSELSATRYSDPGFYGSFGLSYLYFNMDEAKRETKQKTFIHEYQLGYRGNIYSPKLLTYILHGGLYYENVNSNIHTETQKLRIKGKSYKTKFNFLKETKIPFTITAQKNYRPMSTVSTYTSTRYTQNLENYGISGRIMLPVLKLNYSANKGKSLFDSLTRSEERDTKTYRTGLTHKQDNHNVQLSYEHKKENTKGNTVSNETYTIYNKEDNVNLLYRWKINKELELNTNGLFRENDYMAVRYTMASANLRWSPKKSKYSGNLSAVASNSQSNINNNNQFVENAVSNSLTSLNISQSFAYRFSKKIGLSQNFSLSTFDGATITGKNAGFGLGASYNDYVSSTTRFNLSTNLNTRVNTYENNNSSEFTETYSLNIAGGFSEQFNKINSRLNSSLNYYESISENDNIKTYSANALLQSNIFYIFRNNIDVTYNIEDSEVKTTDSLSINRNITRINVGESLSNVARLGVKGSATTKLGLGYSYIDNNNYIVKRVLPKCDVKFTYRLGPKLVFRSNLHIDKDLTYDILNYSTENELKFRSRYSQVSLGYNYNKISAGSISQLTGRESHRFQAKFVRRF